MQTITVDMTPGFRQPTIHYSQNDVGTTFAIDLRSRFGDTLPASPTVKIQATKPSGFGFSIEADSVVDSVATFTTVATMTDEAGRFQAELQIIKDAVVIYTANFYMEGEANPHPIGTTDGSQETIIPTLTLLVERVEAAAASVLDMTVEAETLAAGSQATYSYDEDTNTATFGIPQGEAGAGAAGVTASGYSSSKTYAVGDYAIHNSNLYRCTTAITTAEAFTAAHWTQVVLGDDVTDLKSAFTYDTEQITGAMPILFRWGRYATSQDGGTATYTYATDAVCAKVAVTAGDIVTINGGAISSTQRLYVFEDADGKTFGRAAGNLNGTYTVKVPTGAKFMYINNILSEKASGWWAYKGKPMTSVYPVIGDMQDSIEKIEYGGVSITELMSGGLTSGYYANSGNIVASNSLSHIDVNVQDLSHVKIGGVIHDILPSALSPVGVFFDANGDKVGTSINTSVLPIVVEVPTGAVKLGINSNYKASDYPSSLPDGMYCDEFVVDPTNNYDFISETKKIRMLAGILRNDGTGWALLDNVDHEPINMASVELTQSGQIVVNYGFTASKVLTLVACPDETFAKKYTIGGSVAQDKATFNVCNLPYDIGGLVKYDSTNQVWDITFSTFTGVSFDSTTGELTLTHDSVNGLLTKEKYNFHAQGRSCNVWAGKVTDTTVKIFFLDASGNIIKNPASDLFAYVTRHVNSRMVDASSIVDASGNFWLFGMMEVE